LKTISRPKIKIQAFVHFYQLKGNFKPSRTLDLYILQIEKQKLTIFQLLEKCKKTLHLKRKFSLTKF